ncbi:phage tail assembly chaperone [Schinkia azotoformans]|uniref:phage tail assembly chaperone n=1 Tax=Schinkia azotoformans TaxID=1454 RepID=UPI002DBD31C7|nr:phage portal protein [Schinkia azotoformans]MEC1716603.1 phage portal protein [Schinkia azotoformans]MEC1739441.1 phage portal protein [Schinkia azotoformans]MEC1745489.1 phage portal protein [Schinkia azotoformans]MEC1756552.1 phage portal protein [Schinkia azotoformans]MEC1765819.1 phage portal protein [Schinkia azotoformans]
MSNLQAFFAQNVERVQLEEHVVSKRFKDEKGNPIPWQFGAISGDEDTANRKASTKRMPVPGKKGLFMPETDFELYALKNAVATIKFPDLNNADLQKSYGVMGAETLLQKMLLPGELTEVKKIAQSVNGFDVGMDELVEEAKN